MLLRKMLYMLLFIIDLHTMKKKLFVDFVMSLNSVVWINSIKNKTNLLNNVCYLIDIM